MPLLEANTNTVASIWRPTGEDFGGDRPKQLIHEDLPMFIEPDNRIERDTNGRDRILTGKAAVDAQTADGSTVDVQGGDQLVFNDYRGVEQCREVVLVKPIFVMGQLDHLVMGLE